MLIYGENSITLQPWTFFLNDSEPIYTGKQKFTDKTIEMKMYYKFTYFAKQQIYLIKLLP